MFGYPKLIQPCCQHGVSNDAPSHSRGAMRPRFAGKFLTLLIRGRREYRVHAAPAVPWANCTNKTPTSIQVQRRQSGIPCAMVLTAASCSPRRSGFLVTVISSSLTADLTPASRRQDHTTWHVRNKSAFVLSAPLRPPHPHPAYATIMIRPSERGGMANHIG